MRKYLMSCLLILSFISTKVQADELVPHPPAISAPAAQEIYQSTKYNITVFGPPNWFLYFGLKLPVHQVNLFAIFSMYDLTDHNLWPEDINSSIAIYLMPPTPDLNLAYLQSTMTLMPQAKLIEAPHVIHLATQEWAVTVFRLASPNNEPVVYVRYVSLQNGVRIIISCVCGEKYLPNFRPLFDNVVSKILFKDYRSVNSDFSVSQPNTANLAITQRSETIF
jgi:hypothetical protein